MCSEWKWTKLCGMSSISFCTWPCLTDTQSDHTRTFYPASHSFHSFTTQCVGVYRNGRFLLSPLTPDQCDKVIIMVHRILSVALFTLYLLSVLFVSLLHSCFFHTFSFTCVCVCLFVYKSACVAFFYHSHFIFASDWFYDWKHSTR